MQHTPDVYLDLALIALRKIPGFIKDRALEDYLADELCQSAVERQLEIAGDALGGLRKIAPDLFKQIPDGDLIVGFRNVLAHGYATIDPRKVYEAATSGAPQLLRTIESLLSNLPES
jgi:uncharacterized protein with HEPN domain